MYDRDQWDCCIPVSINKATGSSVQDLTIGRTNSDINKLVFETARNTELPKRPRFVFSDVPLEGATSHDNYRMQADYRCPSWPGASIVVLRPRIPARFELAVASSLLRSRIQRRRIAVLVSLLLLA